uniref:Uncharacterized protein n=1 Tax=Rhizophagus irregularis (strain DAOM 181602 / DAOM 197198 / MUCL 43194) TaxID=747089 RepID=U9UTK0_RHIID
MDDFFIDLFIFKSQPEQGRRVINSLGRDKQSEVQCTIVQVERLEGGMQGASSFAIRLTGRCSIINRSFNKPGLSGIVTLAERFLYQLGRRALPRF